MPTADIKVATLRETLRLRGVECVVDKIHPRFAWHAQATGRGSITEPPLAQLPIDLMDIIGPEEGEVWFGWDWDALHLRLAYGYTGDKQWEEAFKYNHDLHTLTACDLFSLTYPPDKADPHKGKANEAWRAHARWVGKDDPRRAVAKRYVYRLLKGADPYKEPSSIPGIEALGLDKKVVKRIGIQWASNHPAVIRWLDGLRREVKEKGVTRDFEGRRRMHSERGTHAQRAGCDYPTQAGEVEVLQATILEVSNEFSSDIVRFVYHRHDYACWAVDTGQFVEVVPRLTQIAQRTVHINGRDVYLPATFYIQKHGGSKEVWK